MEIRILREEDDRFAFRSGDPALDRFFHEFAGQNQFRLHVGTTYVAADGPGILGFATVAPGHIEADQLSDALRHRFPRYPLPVLRLARLAVDGSARNRGVGAALLRHVCVQALKLSTGYGCIGVIVDAKPDAVDYYSDFGFHPIPAHAGAVDAHPRPHPMFLSLVEIKAAEESGRR